MKNNVSEITTTATTFPSLRTGQKVKVVTIGDAKLLKGGRGLPVNPLAGTVTKEVQYSQLQVSGPGMFEAKMRAMGSEPAGASPWYEWTSEAGIVKHKTSGERYIAFLTTASPIEVKWFVNGRAPSPTEMRTIERYKGAPKSEPIMLTLKLENVESIEPCE